jgi:diguanylate cyclase (GGDEF)-like protein
MIKRFLKSPSSYQRWIFAAGIIPIIFLGLISYYTIRQDILKTAETHLHTVAADRKKALEKFFLQQKLNLENMKEETATLYGNAKKTLHLIQKRKKESIHNYFDNVSAKLILLSQNMLLKNILQVREKQGIFSSEHEEMLRSVAKKFSVKNIYLLNGGGKIVVATANAKKLNKNIETITPALKKAWKIAKSKPKNMAQSVIFADFAPVGKSNIYKAFALVAFEDASGYVVVEIDKKRLNAILHEKMQEYSTAESFLVGKRFNKTWLRSDLVLEAGVIGDPRCSNPISRGLEGLSGIEIAPGASGETVLNAYDPIKISGLNWTLQTTIALEEAVAVKGSKNKYFKTFMKAHGYNDLYLITPGGHIAYTTKHEAEYNTNILNGDFKNTNFSKAVKKVLQTKRFAIMDYQPYKPAHDNPVSFIATALLNENMDVELVIAAQLPVKPINDIMKPHSDMGRSGEVFLVGSDGLMRSDSYLDPKNHSVEASLKNGHNSIVDTPDVKKALNGNEGVEAITDYRGVDVLSSYMPFSVDNIRWALISKMDMDEVEEPLQQLKIKTLLNVMFFMALAYLLLALIERERKKHDKELRQLAYYDKLTGLPNRTLITNRLEQAIRRSKRLNTKTAILAIDLDRFKYINESFGHQVGDEVLKTVAQRISNSAGKRDTVSRIGGDEFVIIMESLKNSSEASALAEKIIADMTSEIEDSAGRRFHIGCSIGISISPDNSSDKDLLVKYADSAMFAAKEKGRNRYMFYQDSMTKAAVEQMTMIGNLRQAIEENQFILYYQPKIDLKSHKVTSVEALIRWEHPELGLIPPDKFIPVAERTGLIIDIGSWVLKEACRSFASWKEAGYTLESVAVNFSTQQLQCRECGDAITSVMKEVCFHPDWLELEITETTLIDNLDITRSNMDKLRDMGIKLAIDDFGTGYSSLSYLKQLPVAAIKIDRSFIRDIENDANDIAIVRAIIAMAKTLDYTVVAEGVETKEQLDILTAESCDIIQGYYFAKPMPENMLLEYLKNFNWKI